MSVFALNRTNSKNMEKYHGIRPNEDFPYNASQFGFTVQDRQLVSKKNSETGLRENLIPFQFIGDDIPSIPKQANWDDVVIPGRFEGVKSYTSSGSSDISIRLIYIALGTKKKGHKTFWSIENIEVLTRKLQSLVYPNYSPKFSPPDTILLNMGSIFIDVPLKIKGVTVSNKAPFDTGDLTARTKEINIEAVVSYPVYQSIEAKDIAFSTTGNKIFAYKKFSQVNLK